MQSERKFRLCRQMSAHTRVCQRVMSKPPPRSRTPVCSLRTLLGPAQPQDTHSTSAARQGSRSSPATRSETGPRAPGTPAPPALPEGVVSTDMDPLQTPIPPHLSALATRAAPAAADALAAGSAEQLAAMRVVPPVTPPSLTDCVLCVSGGVAGRESARGVGGGGSGGGVPRCAQARCSDSARRPHTPPPPPQPPPGPQAQPGSLCSALSPRPDGRGQRRERHQRRRGGRCGGRCAARHSWRACVGPAAARGGARG